MAQMVALIMMMVNLHSGKEEGDIYASTAVCEGLEKRTNTSPSITANDKTS